MYENFFGIPIFIDKKINPMYVKANTKIIKEEKEFLDTALSYDYRSEILKKKWKEKYKADLILDDELEKNYILFQTESDKTLFLLKFR